MKKWEEYKKYLNDTADTKNIDNLKNWRNDVELTHHISRIIFWGFILWLVIIL